MYAASVQSKPGPGRDADDGPYVVVLVDLDAGVRMMSNVVGCPPERRRGGDAPSRWRGNRCPTAGTCRCSDPPEDRCRSPTSPRPCPSWSRHAAERFGDHTYLVADDERLTYGDVDARSAALAKGLLAEGIGKGSRVGILIPNSVDFVVAAPRAWHASVRCSCPMNTFSQTRELGWLLRHADVTHARHAPDAS